MTIIKAKKLQLAIVTLILAIAALALPVYPINFVRNFVALNLVGTTDFDSFINAITADDISLYNSLRSSMIIGGIAANPIIKFGIEGNDTIIQ